MSHPATRNLFLIGSSHRTASLEWRERLAVDADELEELYRNLGEAGVEEAVILNTCNRVELYCVGAGTAPALMAERLCRLRSIGRDEFDEVSFALSGLEGVRHLYEVCVGLDSQILGEAEILGQVKEAYSGAGKRGQLGPVLNRVFQKAFQAAKWVRTHTAIGEGNVSIASVAVDLANRICGDLAHLRVLVAGAGEIGEKAVRALMARGARDVTVSSRTFERAGETARRLGAKALPFEHRAAHLEEYDIVLCSTAAPGTVVSKDTVAAAISERPAKPLLLIDLALPRDIDPAAGSLTNVFLYNLDDLAQISEENRIQREAEIERCREHLHRRADAAWSQVGRFLATEDGGVRLEDISVRRDREPIGERMTN